jgi:hypothetical protein
MPSVRLASLEAILTFPILQARGFIYSASEALSSDGDNADDPRGHAAVTLHDFKDEVYALANIMVRDGCSGWIDWRGLHASDDMGPNGRPRQLCKH